ncbi:hypothetical protein VPH35_049368 [Triticum aestivum]
MAMALRTMAANLKQKVPAAVQRVFASRPAPAPVDADLDRLGPEFRRILEKIVEQHEKRRRDEALAFAAGGSLGVLTFLFGVSRLS